MGNKVFKYAVGAAELAIGVALMGPTGGASLSLVFAGTAQIAATATPRKPKSR